MKGYGIMTSLPIEVMFTAGIVLLALALVILSAIATRRKVISKIKETSARYLAYKALCEKYQYLSVEGDVEYYERLESKYKFDHFNFDKYVFGQVCKERDKFEEMLDAVEINRKLLTEFEEEYKLLPDFTENPPSWLYSVLEHTVMRNEEKHRKSPTTKFTITCSIRYTSPAGRNRYANYQTYSTEDVEGFVNQSYALEKERESKEYQRRILTPSLRYDILKRDNFKCVICGRTPKRDGITLHVDHIIPVSKGGKTEPENLRTLCSICNLGKSDKYDENGLN
jgi:hypothetical protein